MRIILGLLVTVLICLTLLAAPAAQAASLRVSTFDSNDEGWRVVGDAQGASDVPNYSASGGNPGGYISANDDAVGGVWYWSAPTKFLGNVAAAYGKTLSFDLRQSALDTQFDADDVILLSSALNLAFDTANNPGLSWTSYSVPLIETAGWKKQGTTTVPTPTEMQSVLASLTGLQIRGEFRTGADTGSLDNVRLEATASDTVGIFRPSNATFYLRNANTTGPADITAVFGANGDRPVSGDWNNDDVDTIGVYRNGTFYLKDANTTGAPLAYQFTLGNPGDLPMAGDWDGDGKDGVGTFRPTNGLLYLRNTLSTGFADFAMVLGIANDQPVAGDWDGDGYDSPGVYRPSNSQFYLTNKRCNCIVFADYNLTLGNVGDVGFAGDWDGNGLSGVGVFRPTNGRTYLKNALTTGFADVAIVYGIAGDRPVAGKWIAITTAPKQAPVFAPGR